MILSTNNIHKIYHNTQRTLHILKGIDLEIQKGEMIAIVGPSGAGKSTLLHILGGLDTPTEGTVFLEGKDLYSLNDAARARVRNSKIGFVFQFYHLLPEFTALENVLLPMIVKEGKSDLKKFQAMGTRLLEQVGLKDRITHKPNQLSGGEQQRVAIARAMANDPQIILCDEPTGNLDSETGREIIHMLVNLNKQNKQTLVMVTHDVNMASLAHRTIYMRDGELTK